MTTFTVNNKDYKLALTTSAIIELEKKLGRNPVELMMDLGNSTMIKVSDIVNVLHYSLQKYNHNIGFNETCDIYDEYLSSGKTMFDFINDIMVPLFKDAGLLANDEGDGKN